MCAVTVSLIINRKNLLCYGFIEIAILWHFLDGKYHEVTFFKDSAVLRFWRMLHWVEEAVEEQSEEYVAGQEAG